MPAPGPGSSFAHRLNYLFDNLRPSVSDKDYRKKATSTGEFTNGWVAKVASELGPTSITSTYIKQLRDPAESKNPSGKIIQTLANFFEVKPSYFLDDDVAQSIVGQFDLVRKLNDQGVAQIALRAAALSPANKKNVLALIEQVRKMEGLPPTPEELA
ncbi:hypothetical protein [Streptomyces sp. NPDC058758]|uniref:hypothetical protein n=1 Tax=Streptomyces sp. NPDC058758 TaxID=3346627 RepID=UPI0036A72ED5